jgi:hypothetical protein
MFSRRSPSHLSRPATVRRETVRPIATGDQRIALAGLQPRRKVAQPRLAVKVIASVESKFIPETLATLKIISRSFSSANQQVHRITSALPLQSSHANDRSLLGLLTGV